MSEHVETAAPEADAHPNRFKLYTVLILILGLVTFVEWQLLPGKMLYMEALHPVLKPVLIILSVFKFFAVVLVYMHLVYDAAIYKRLFFGGLCLALTCVFVVMAVLKALPGGAPDKGRIAAHIRPMPPEMAAAVAAAKIDRSGEDVYNGVCVACHQADGKGRVGAAAIAADLTEAALWAKGDTVLMKSVTFGTTGKIGAMPAQKGVLSDVEIDNVFAYVKKTFKK